MRLVPNQPLREAFERSGMTAQQLAVEMGYTRIKRGRQRPEGDDSPVRRALGLKPYTTGPSPTRPNSRPTSVRHPPQTLMYEGTALRYAEALGLDGHEVGL